MSADASQGPVVSLSTSSVYPGSTAVAFATAKRLGFDGVEVMVGTDETSADIAAVKGLADRHEIAVTAIHAPCLLITQRVWGTDPWRKLHISAEMAHTVGADTVVVHPPFRWQREYARDFVNRIIDLEAETDMVFAVENMYPWRTGRREFQAYSPGWDPRAFDYPHVTLDLSHASTARVDSLTMVKDLGERLSHLHLTDGTGSALDEHLVPGRGDQQAEKVLNYLAEVGYAGHITVEITTRRAEDDEARELDLIESLAFTRLHFDAPTARQSKQNQ